MSSTVNKTYSRLLDYGNAYPVPDYRVQMVSISDFLRPYQCSRMIELINQALRPSTIADSNGDPDFRTSRTADLSSLNPDVRLVNTLLDEALGIDEWYGEPLQGQRYDVGQEFKAHTDYFDPDSRNFAHYTEGVGNRTWTAMIYLNEPIAGGSTHFDNIDMTLRPETGRLVAWNNLTLDGQPNPATVHHGMRVRSGVKYILTKWYRERSHGP